MIIAVDASHQATSALRASVFALGTALRLMVRVARPRWRIRMPGDAYRRCMPRVTAIGRVDIEAGGDEFALATHWERCQPLVAASAMRRATDPQACALRGQDPARSRRSCPAALGRSLRIRLARHAAE